jgi:hypothetical protein
MAGVKGELRLDPGSPDVFCCVPLGLQLLPVEGIQPRIILC